MTTDTDKQYMNAAYRIKDDEQYISDESYIRVAETLGRKTEELHAIPDHEYHLKECEKPDGTI